MLNYQLITRRLLLSSMAAQIFEAVCQKSPYAFWFDSSRHEPGEARFSFMGLSGGPEAYRVEGFVGGATTILRSGSEPELVNDNIFHFLEERLASTTVRTDDVLPFEFHGGFVGWLGYELMAITEKVPGHAGPIADAVLLFADRFIAIDHLTGELYLAALHRGDSMDAEAWLAGTQAVLQGLATQKPLSETPLCLLKIEDVEPFLLHAKAAYLEQIAQAKQQILDGESYEICLTNRVRVPLVSSTEQELFNAYLGLRQINPAPYAAFLHFGVVTVLCSSPERFLKVAPNGVVETKPIKGTMRRGKDSWEDDANRKKLLEDQKFFSENLMIVDLLRNDLTRTCVPGSVHVPSLMHVESYSTVHQLVSTIRGVLKCSPIRCIMGCFPGGSMTGAPKKRTLEIIHGLEEAPRGIYSGVIGYLSLNGAIDLNIVIRTAVIHKDMAEIGVGGAIIHLSDAEEEYEEMLLKALAPFSAIAPLTAFVPVTEPQSIELEVEDECNARSGTWILPF